MDPRNLPGQKFSTNSQQKAVVMNDPLGRLSVKTIRRAVFYIPPSPSHIAGEDGGEIGDSCGSTQERAARQAGHPSSFRERLFWLVDRMRATLPADTQTDDAHLSINRHVIRTLSASMITTPLLGAEKVVVVVLPPSRAITHHKGARAGKDNILITPTPV
ncbi:hypothetical protein Bbelb_296670 [Branchiostoma belcheri]|nr:hypothetical protein Bbelb_296670 [Branchiostoma belcheri]